MAFKLAEAFVKIVVDKQGVDAGLKSVQDGAAKTNVALDSIATHAKVVFATLTAGIGIFAKLSSDAEESESKFAAVFKNQAASARQWSIELGRDINRSSITIRTFMSTLQDTFVPLGFSRDRARELSQQITQLGFDLASFNNVAEDETIQLLTSGIVGNHEALRRFGIVITEATLKQELLRLGYKGNVAQADELTKVQARLNIIMNSTTDAQGDAARTSESFANTLKGLVDQSKELAIVVGEELKPALRSIMEMLNNLVVSTKEGDKATIQMGARWLEVGVQLSAIAIVLPKVIGGVGTLARGVSVLLGGLGTGLSGGLLLSLSLLATAFTTAKLNGESLGETVLRLTHGLAGMKKELFELEAMASRDAILNSTIRSVETTKGTEDAPEAIRQALSKLRAELKVVEQEQFRALQEGRFEDGFGRGMGVSKEARERVKQLGVDKGLLESHIGMLEQELRFQERLAEQLKKRRLEQEKLDKAEADGAKKFEKETGLSAGFFRALTGMSLTGPELARGAHRAKWDTELADRADKESKAAEKERKATESKRKAAEEAAARRTEQAESARRADVRRFRGQGITASEGREIMGALFAGGTFAALLKTEEYRKHRDKRESDSRTEIFGVGEINRQIQQSIREKKAEEAIEKLHNTVKNEGIKIKNVDDFAKLFGWG